MCASIKANKQQDKKQGCRKLKEKQHLFSQQNYIYSANIYFNNFNINLDEGNSLIHSIGFVVEKHDLNNIFENS